MYIRRFTFLLVTAVTLAVLVACGGAPGPVENPFKVNAISTDIAAHGDTVTITGAGLKDAKVFLGGSEVVAASRADTTISFVVPGAAPSGPQTLSVRAGDKTSDHSLFIGVDFPSGTLEDLAALNLPPGTAVRLAAHTYTSSGTVQLNNLSLYGVDPTKTVLDLVLLSVVPEAMLAMKVDPDAELVIKDLSVHLGAFVVSGTGYAAVPFSVEDSVDNYSDFSGAMRLNQIAETQDTGSGSLTFDNVLITDNNVAEETLFSLTGVDVTPVHVNILNSEITGEMSFVLLVASGLTIENSTIDTGMIFAGGFHELTTVNNSRLEANHPSGSEVFILALRGLQFDNAQVVASEKINIGIPEDMKLPVISTIVVRDSSFTVPAPTGGLSSDPVFAMEIFMQNALFDNVEFNLAGVSEFSVGLASQVAFNNSQFVLGAAAFPDDGALLHFILAHAFASSITVMDSSIIFESDGNIGLMADGVNEGENSIEFVGNTIAGLAGKSETALHIELGDIDGDLAITATDNEFSGFERALFIDYSSGGTGFVTGKIHDNVFDFDISNVGDVAVLEGLTDGNIFFDASNNVWGDHTVTADVEALIDYTGTSDPSTFKVAPITPAP